MKKPISAEPVLREGLTYTIRLRDGRKITDAVYNACMASGKAHFAKGDEIYPAEEVVRHSIGGRKVPAACRKEAGPGTEPRFLIPGCTAFYDRDARCLTVEVFGREIISGQIARVDEEDYWISHRHDGRELDFNLHRDKDTGQCRLTVYPVTDRKTDGGVWQTIPLAFDLTGEVKNLLCVLGTRELRLENVEQPSMALWWDNHGDPHEITVQTVGIDDKDDLYLTLDDDWGGKVQIWESFGQLSDNDLELVLENIREYMDQRSDPDRVAIMDNVDEVVEVITIPTVNPDLFRRRVKCLMLAGLSQEKAEQMIATTPLQLSLFYDIGRGVFAIDAEAVGNTPLYNPYTGKEIPDETGK